MVTASVVLLAAAACVPPPEGYTPASTDAVTRGHKGVQGDGPARGASTSADGTWTAFSSSASNLVPGDGNGVDDVFLRNNRTGAVSRIAEDAADTPTISRDGRFVGYRLNTTSYEQVYGVHDRVAGTSTTWLDAPQMTVPAVTDGGRFAVTGTGPALGLYPSYCKVRDLSTGVSTDCPAGADVLGSVALTGVSGNARYVMYHWSDPSGGGTSGYFLYDVIEGEATRLEGTFLGIGVSHVVSDDGSTIVSAGWGSASPIMLHDVATQTSEPLVTLSESSQAAVLGLSPNGRYLGFVTDSTGVVPDDTNDTFDVFRVDLVTRDVERVSSALDTGAELDQGALMCGRHVGQVLEEGRMCIYGLDEISPTDSNGFPDAFLTG